MEITADLVRRLVRSQHPQWGDLPVSPVPRQGHDNRTFRLGDELAVRLPSAEGYVAAVAKEDAALPLLARHLALPVPEPVATGEPGEGYPFPWSVRRWLPGQTPDRDPALDRERFAHDLGAWLAALHGVPTDGGLPAGRHSFHRGEHPSVYDADVEECLEELGDAVDAGACRAIWADALETRWTGGPVWFHGDFAAGNLLTTDGRLSAVIDFGTCGTGDPACDLVVAWTFLDPAERRVFAEAVGLDDGTWRRARGWALWKSLLVMTNPESPELMTQRRAHAALLGAD